MDHFLRRGVTFPAADTPFCWQPFQSLYSIKTTGVLWQVKVSRCVAQFARYSCKEPCHFALNSEHANGVRLQCTSACFWLKKKTQQIKWQQLWQFFFFFFCLNIWSRHASFLFTPRSIMSISHVKKQTPKRENCNSSKPSGFGCNSCLLIHY